MHLRAATRGSRLALWQTRHIAELLGFEVEPVIVQTIGDRTQATNTPIEAIPEQSVFAKEVQNAVLDGRADFAVHSAKDLSSSTIDGLSIAAIPERGDPRDVLIGASFESLPAGGVVATSSIRRRAQIASRRTDVTFATLRGNYDTRVARAADFDAIVLAAAPIARLNLSIEDVHYLEPETFVPQVGQGALAVECRGQDEALIDMLQAIEHVPTRRAVDAERAFLAELGGSCDLPVGAYATVVDGEVSILTLLASHDGRVVLRAKGSAMDGEKLGCNMANKLLHEDGGAALLIDYRTGDR